MAEQQPGDFVPANYDWLLLRFDADEASRSPALVQAVSAYAAGLPDARRDAGPDAEIEIVDLGAGAGANLLHVAPLLPVATQRWTLVDRDAALVERVQAFHETFARRRPGLVELEGQRLRFQDRRVDYRAHAGNFLDAACPIYRQAPDLIVANAVFDLMTAEQFGAFLDLACTHWRAARPAMYFTIHPDGGVRFEPGDDDDARITALFHAHMRRPQSFGRAMGATSAGEMRRALEARGFQVTTAPSALRMHGAEKTLLHANLDFFESAVGEMIAVGAGDGLTAAALQRWVADKRHLIDLSGKGALAMEIGQQDHWARWP
jgi:hypothetical protein